MSKFKNEEEFLKHYDPKQYTTPDGYTCDTAVFTIVSEVVEQHKKTPPKRILKIMLIQRSETDADGNPNIEGGKWALPGGFVAPTEGAIDAAIRELEDETGVKNVHLKHFGVYDKPGRDKRGWIISNAYYAIVNEEQLSRRKPREGVRAVGLFDIDEALGLELAFDHKQIILDAIGLIKKDIIQTTVAKNFLPKEFTLSELRDVLLSVTKLPTIEEKSVFFKKTPTLPFIKLIIDKNGEPITTDKYSYRPARLYSFNEAERVASIYD